MLAASMALAMVGCGGGGDKTLNTADIVIDNLGFHPSTVTVRANSEVTLSVLNKDKRDHTFVLTFLDVNKPIPQGQRVDVKLKIGNPPPAGFYSFYSDQYQYEGYQGKIKVKSK